MKIRREISKQAKNKKDEKVDWFSEEMWRLHRRKASFKLNKNKSQELKTKYVNLRKYLRSHIRKDRVNILIKVGSMIQQHLIDKDMGKGWKIARHWYKHQ